MPKPTRPPEDPPSEVTETFSGPKAHDLSKIKVAWRRDGSVVIEFPKGTGPVDLICAGLGNFRRARFTVRRRQL